MRHAAAIIALGLVVAVAAIACSPAQAQEAVRPRARPQVPAAAAPVTTPAPASTAAATTVERLSLTGLPRRFDAAPACRAQCSSTRMSCEAVAETCAPEWNACLRGCSAT